MVLGGFGKHPNMMIQTVIVGGLSEPRCSAIECLRLYLFQNHIYRGEITGFGKDFFTDLIVGQFPL